MSSAPQTGASIFISYKREHEPTQAIMPKILARLQTEGYQPYVDEDSVGIGGWERQLSESLLRCQGAVVLVSEAAIKDSAWCRREWEVLAVRYAAEGLPIVPVLIDVSRDDFAKLSLSPIQAFKANDNLEEQVLEQLTEVLPPHEITRASFLHLHHAWLRYLYRSAPALGEEPFTLKQIYQDTECGELEWKELQRKNDGHDNMEERIDPEREQFGGRFDAVETACRLITDENFPSETIVVRGVAGAGKSSFCLRLAEELIEKHQLSPIFIRFRDLTLTQLGSRPIEQILSEAVQIGRPGDWRPTFPGLLIDDNLLSEPATEHPGNLCRHVFILDGWDEVSLTGQQSYQQQLEILLPKLREYFLRNRNTRVRFVVTGRPSVEVGGTNILYPQSKLLTLRSLQPQQLTAFAEALAEHGEEWTLADDQAGKAVEKYRKWYEKRESDSIPDEIRSLEMMGLPLLALLTFRTLAQSDKDVTELLESPTALYQALANQTVEHGGKGAKEEGMEGVTLAHLSGPRLRSLLRHTAAMISILDGETITRAELEARLQELGDPGLLGSTDDLSNSHPLSNLVISFYFKGGQSDLGCEFLHKSFREYFFAESLVNLLETTAEENPSAPAMSPLPYWKDFPEGSAQFQLSRSLSRLLAPQWQKPEERRHLFWLLESAIRAEPLKWIGLRDLLADVYGWWAEGVPLRFQPRMQRGRRELQRPYIHELMEWALPFTDDNANPMRSVTLDGHLGDSLLQLTALLHHELRDSLPEQASSNNRQNHKYQTWDKEGRTCRFRPGGAGAAGGHFRSLISRIDAVGFRPTGPRLTDSFLASVDLSSALLELEDLGRSNLASVNLTGATLYGAYLGDSDLSGANLYGANLYYANLHSSNLHSSNLAAVNLHNAKLADANIANANLTYSELTGADLTNANLTNTNLTNANLTNADLSNCVNLNSATGIPVAVLKKWQAAQKKRAKED